MQRCTKLLIWSIALLAVTLGGCGNTNKQKATVPNFLPEGSKWVAGGYDFSWKANGDGTLYLTRDDLLLATYQIERGEKYKFAAPAPPTAVTDNNTAFDVIVKDNDANNSLNLSDIRYAMYFKPAATILDKLPQGTRWVAGGADIYWKAPCPGTAYIAIDERMYRTENHVDKDEAVLFRNHDFNDYITKYSVRPKEISLYFCPDDINNETIMKEGTDEKK